MNLFKPYCLALGCLLAASAASQRVLQVRAPVRFAEALGSIAAEFEKGKKGVDVRVGTSGSGAVTVGEAAGSGRVFAVERVVAVVRIGDPRISSFAHLGSNMSVAVPDAKSTAGARAAKVLAAAALRYGKAWSDSIDANLKTGEIDDGEAVKMVLGEKADAAIVLASEARRHATLRAVSVPAEFAADVQYAATWNGSLGESFVEFLFSKGNQMRLEAAGFTSPLRVPQELLVERPNAVLRLFTAAVPTLKQDRIKVGSRTALGASLRSILANDKGTVTFVGADRQKLSMPIASIKSAGGVLESMGGGNYRAVLPGGRVVRWVRRIVIAE